MRHRSRDHRMGLAGMNIGVEGIGPGLIDIDQRPAMHLGDEFVAVEGAIAIQNKSVGIAASLAALALDRMIFVLPSAPAAAVFSALDDISAAKYCSG